MQEPKERYWKVTKQEIGTELGNPNWVEWAKQEIAALRNCRTQAASTLAYINGLKQALEIVCSGGEYTDAAVTQPTDRSTTCFGCYRENSKNITCLSCSRFTGERTDWYEKYRRRTARSY